LTRRASRARARRAGGRAADRFFVPAESAGSGEDSASAAILPCAGEGRQHGDGADGCAAVLGALHAVIEAQGGGPGGCVFVGELLDLSGGHAGPCGYARGGVFAGAFGEGGETVGHGLDVGPVF